MKDIRQQLKEVSQRIKEGMADTRRGTQEERRQALGQIGTFRELTRLTSQDEVRAITGGRAIFATDGSINTWPPAGQWPHQLFILRALSTDPRTVRHDVERKRVYTPLIDYLFSEGETPEQIRFRAKRDTERILAALEVETAIEALLRHAPFMMWMDGPLVRLEMQARQRFAQLRELATAHQILLVGVIENIDSSSIDYLFGDGAPRWMRGKKDRDILWDTLRVGEVFQLHAPAKGLPRDEEEKGAPIRTWFLRCTYAKGAIGLDLLEEQVTLAEKYRLADLVYSLSEPAGRGIPAIMDYVDSRVRISHAEMQLYLNELDPEIVELLETKRGMRPH